MDTRIRTGRGVASAVGKLVAGAVLALFVLSLGNPGERDAEAAFHLMFIEEVLSGVPSDPTVQYVELRMFEPGQNFVAGHQMRFFDSTGAVSTFTMGTNVPLGNDNSRILIATASAATYFGVAADFVLPVPAITSTGMVCFDNPIIDCVPYGGYTNANINRGPATPLGPGDGTNALNRMVSTTNNATNDFGFLCASPQNNAGAIGSGAPTDVDGDLIAGCADNCPTVANPGQANNDAPGGSFGGTVPPAQSWITDGTLALQGVTTGGNDCDRNDDNDASCSDVEELGGDINLGGARNPLNPWDFADVPVPALQASAPNGVRNGVVLGNDALAAFFYSGTSNGGPPNGNGVDYDTDLNGNGVEDGVEYDRTSAGALSGPPNGAITGSDALAVFNQSGDSCAALPN